MSLLLYFISFVATIFMPLKINEIAPFFDIISFFQVLIPLLIFLFAKYKKAILKYFNYPEIARDGIKASLLLGVLETLLGIVVLGSNITTEDMPEILPPALSVIVMPLIYSIIFALFMFLPFTKNSKD